MRIVGVIDLKHGRAVHARGGDRDSYRPVEQAGGRAIDGDPVALATAYRDVHGISEIYVADLDAIAGSVAQDAAVDALLKLDLAVWLDAGTSSWPLAQEQVNRGVTRVVVGLETLTSFEALDVICISIGGQRVAFSLDMRGGEPLPGPPVTHQHPGTVRDIAARAARSGVGAIIALDLARVGSAGGLDLDLLAAIRQAAPGVVFLAGGGVRGPDDLTRLESLGCDGVLAATMLQSVRR